MSDKISMKDKLAQLRNISEGVPGKPTENKEPEIKKNQVNKGSTQTDQPTSSRSESNKTKRHKSESVVPEDVAKVYSEQGFDLVDRIKDFEVSPDTKRMTYIIDKRNFDILNAIKSETGTPVINLINFFLDEAIKANGKEIDKIIRKQYQNLRL